MGGTLLVAADPAETLVAAQLQPDAEKKCRDSNASFLVRIIAQYCYVNVSGPRRLMTATVEIMSDKSVAQSSYAGALESIEKRRRKFGLLCEFGWRDDGRWPAHNSPAKSSKNRRDRQSQ